MTDDLLFELENYIKTIWGFLPIPIAYVSHNGVLLEVNKRFNELFNLSETELVGQELIKLNNVFKEVHKKALKKNLKDYKLVFNERTFIVSTQLHKEAKGRVIGYFISLTDITAQVKFQQVLKASEARYKQIFNLSPESIIVLDEKGLVINVNDQFIDWLGYKKSEVIGQKLDSLKFIIKSDCDKIVNKFNHRVKGKEVLPYELTFKHKSGKQLIGQVHGTLIKGPDGQAVKDLLMITDVTVLKEVEKIRLEQEQSREVNQIRDQFLMRVSHELRHPLVPIIGYSQVMLEEYPSDIQRNYLNKILDNSKRLKDLIDKLIDVSSLESARSVINLEEVNLKSLINKLLSDFSTKFKLKGLTVKTHLDDVTVMVDKLRMRKAINNLLENAVKFTESGVINISLSSADDFVKIVVKDTGKGMTNKELELIRKTASEVEVKATQMYTGLKLGLLLVKLVVKAHHGEFIVDSELGKGSSFTIKIPRGLTNDSIRE